MSTTAFATLSPKDVNRLHEARESLYRCDFPNAIDRYARLLKHHPGVAELWFEMGNSAVGASDFALAHKAYQQSARLSPTDGVLLTMIGRQYQAMRKPEDARAYFERAVEAAPDSIDAHISLAVWLERERRLDESWDIVEACRAENPNDDQIRYYRAFLCYRMGRIEEAETALRDLIKDSPQYPYVRYAAPYLLGQVLDRQGKYEEAFRWLNQAKDIVRGIADCALLEREYDRHALRRAEVVAGLSPELICKWQAERSEFGNYQLAFLGGHPRSGTTLLEQVLDAHPDVQAFDEPLAFNRVVTGYFDGLNGASDMRHALENIGPGPLADLRRRYLRGLLLECDGETSAKVLVDKNPSPTAALHLWLRVFPGLRVIIALRDPRDVVLSCYFQNIPLNATNVNFLSLERTARHYTDLMEIWLRIRDYGGFSWIESRYEDLVGDLPAEGRRVMEFLGAGWHGEQSRFHEAAGKKVLHAPTYHDVTQPVYERSRRRWEAYAQELEPILEKLEPYCRAFGYRD